MEAQTRKTFQHDGTTFAPSKNWSQVADFLSFTPPPPLYLR
jgi:hypothetical protein